MCLCGAFMMYAHRTIKCYQQDRSCSKELLRKLIGGYVISKCVEIKVTDNTFGGSFSSELHAIAYVFLQRLLFPAVNEADFVVQLFIIIIEIAILQCLRSFLRVLSVNYTTEPS